MNYQKEFTIKKSGRVYGHEVKKGDSIIIYDAYMFCITRKLKDKGVASIPCFIRHTPYKSPTEQQVYNKFKKYIS